MTAAETPTADPVTLCETCGKPTALCVCSALTEIATRTAVAILQHPQEHDEVLGTARLTALQLSRSVLRVGLSWPSLKRVLGREVDAKRWAVLYLGAAQPKTLTPAAAPPPAELALVDAKGQPLPDSAALLRRLDGIVLLDGTWSQAKTLWWRNPWMLKCRRLVLHPRFRSRYGKLRREPRRDSLSTLEAAALCLSHLEKDPTLFDRLTRPFDLLIEKCNSRGL